MQQKPIYMRSKPSSYKISRVQLREKVEETSIMQFTPTSPVFQKTKSLGSTPLMHRLKEVPQGRSLMSRLPEIVHKQGKSIQTEVQLKPLSRTSRLCSNYNLMRDVSSPSIDNTKLNLLDLSKVQCYHQSETGWNKQEQKKNNQDCIMVSAKPSYLIYGVCDGHGHHGHLVSNLVSQRVLDNLESSLAGNDYMLQFHTQLYQTIIKNAFLKADQSLDGTKLQLLKSGSTCNVVMIVQRSVVTSTDIDINIEPTRESILYCCNVGDSRAILVTTDQRVFPLSVDQKPDLPEERKRIIQKGGIIEHLKDLNGNDVGPPRVWVEDKSGPGLAMSRSFGDRLGQSIGVIAEPAILEHKISIKDQFIVIASDGVWEHLSNKQVATIVSNCMDEQRQDEACQRIIELADQEWRKNDIVVDDITCVIIFLNQC